MNKDLIPALLVLYFKAKDLHYAYLTVGRKGDHAFMDRYTDGIMDFIDLIQEVANRAVYSDYMSGADILRIASERMGKFKQNASVDEQERELSEIIAECLDLCDKYAREQNRATGTVNVLNGISEKLQQLYGFQPNNSK